MTLTHERLLELVNYDPETGVFTAKIARPRVVVGARLGTMLTTGYLHVTILGEHYAMHRLAWFFMTGRWPAVQIDHRNRIRSDNRWDNLREATNGQNGVSSGTTWGKTGIRGVCPAMKHGKLRYRAVLARKHLGYFHTPEEARAAYERAVQAAYGEFAPHS